MPGLFEEMEQYAQTHNVPIIRSKSLTTLLDTLRQHQPKRILEIGTAIAYSTLKMAQACPSAWIDSIELNPERYGQAEYFVGKSGFCQIRLHLGDASDLLKQLAGPFDFVFLDAAKGQYLRQLGLIEPKLSPKAVIVADNVLFRGYVLGNDQAPRRYRTIVKRLQAYLKAVNEPPFSTCLWEEADGLAVTLYEQDNERGNS